MTLITILICLALQRLAKIGGWFTPSWFENYLKHLNPWLRKFNEWISLGIIVLPILLIIGLLQLIFKTPFFGLLNLILSVLIFMLCIDARDLKIKLKDFFVAQEKNDLLAASTALSNFTHEAAPQDFASLNRAHTKAIFAETFAQVFAPLFWFIILGPLGVAGYFVIKLTSTPLSTKVDSNNAGMSILATKIIAILDWVPARIVGFSYALAGNFSKGINYCYKNILLPIKNSALFAVDSALAALNVEADPTKADIKENIAAFDLINRTLIIWIIGVLLFSVGYWM